MLGISSSALRRWGRQLRFTARDRGGKALVRALRLTGAAIASYLVAEQIFPGTKPLLAPLTALLVVQVTLYSTLKTSAQRVASVLAGVLVAVLFSNLFGFSALSLAALIAASIFIGQFLHLRDQLLEVPISAMLVMAVGGTDASAAGRITETLVGAGVGVLYHVVLPGPVQSRTAGEAVEQFALEMGALLSQMADEFVFGVSAEKAGRWLDEARRLAHRIGRVDQALVNAQESRRLNVRALGTMDAVPSLRSGLDALEHCTVALRGLCRAIVDRVEARPDVDGGYPLEVREIFAVMLLDLAAAVRAFGRLVRTEAEAEAEPEDAALSVAVDSVREARVRLTELLLTDPRDNAEMWGLHGTLLANVERVLREIDVEERLRQREKRRQQWETRAAAVQTVDRLRATSRQVARRPIRRHRHEESRTRPE